MQASFNACLQKVVLEDRITALATLAKVWGVRGRTDHSRHGGIVILDNVAPGKHLLLDGVVTTAHKNPRIKETGYIPGYTAKLVEDMKY